MAIPRFPAPALLIVAAFSRHTSALAWGRQQLEESYGPIAFSSPLFAFDQTAYYEPTMGPGLRKQLWAFQNLIAPDRLAEVKLHTNELETLFQQSHACAEARPLNLDPGYLVLGKFLLATTKDQAHRIYLRDGIFAEVTLHYHAGAFEPWPWTYADYRLPDVLDFLEQARTYFKKQSTRSLDASDPLS